MADKATPQAMHRASSARSFVFPNSSGAATAPAATSASVAAADRSASGNPDPARAGVPKLMLRPGPPATPPPSYASGSQTQRTPAPPPASASTSSAAGSKLAAVDATVSGQPDTAGAASPSRVRGASDDAGLPESVAERARRWGASPLIKPPPKMALPPLSLPDPAPPDDVPPPGDLPPLPAKPASGGIVTPRKGQVSGPVFLATVISPRSAQSPPTIKEIAADIVAAELQNGLNVKQIGRSSPKLNGVSVYNQLARFVNAEMAKSDFAGVVDRCRTAAVKGVGKDAGKLVSVEGSSTGTTGEHTGVNLKRIARYLKPVFEFVCGSEQRFADSRLPTGVLALLKAIDRELVGTLLARRKQQLVAQKLWSATLAPDALADEMRKQGWTDAEFNKLVGEGVFTSAQIHAFRVHMFSGLLFTRCVSPFILYSSDELQQDSAKRTATPAQALVRLSEGANKLFRKEQAGFVEDFIRESGSVLPEDSALALATLTSGEERFATLKKSKASPSGKNRTYKRAPGRHSAPSLPQGGDLRKLMEKEGRAHDVEVTSARQAPAPADYKALRDAAIDRFKSGHPKDFADEAFSIAFNGALRLWKQTHRDLDVKAIPAALENLYRQAKTPMPMNTGGFTAAVSSVPAPDRARSMLPPPGSSLPLSDDKTILLNRFMRKEERKASFERYPELAQRVQERAVRIAMEDGNFIFRLKEIFEEELIHCFSGTSRLLGNAPHLSRKELRELVGKWKQTHWGRDVTLEVLWELAPALMRALTLDTVKTSSLTRNAEAVTEAFLRRKEVAGELRDKPALKRTFLHDVRSWIAIGAFSTEPAATVQKFYHDALTAQYQERCKADKANPAQIQAIELAAMQWWADNSDAVLTTPILETLFAAIVREA